MLTVKNRRRGEDPQVWVRKLYDIPGGVAIDPASLVGGFASFIPAGTLLTRPVDGVSSVVMGCRHEYGGGTVEVYGPTLAWQAVVGDLYLTDGSGTNKNLAHIEAELPTGRGARISYQLNAAQPGPSEDVEPGATGMLVLIPGDRMSWLSDNPIIGMVGESVEVTPGDNVVVQCVTVGMVREWGIPEGFKNNHGIIRVE